MSPDSGNPNSPLAAQLTQSLKDVLIRLEGLATKIETQYLSKELWRKDSERLDEIIRGLRVADSDMRQILDALDGKYATKEEVGNIRTDVVELQDERKWVIRLVIGLVIVGIVTAYLASGGTAK